MIKVEADISSPAPAVLTVEAVVKQICLEIKRDPARRGDDAADRRRSHLSGLC